MRKLILAIYSVIFFFGNPALGKRYGALYSTVRNEIFGAIQT